MSNFNRLSELLNTTDGMTVLRNNSANDDGIDTVSGVDWFTFNGVVANKIYVSGNTYVGFGSSSEHLKICRRDAKMWYLYRQEGMIGGKIKFLKLRWEGYSQYNQTSSEYSLKWELFLFDDGGLYLNLFTVPSASGYLGTSQLICGSRTYPFTVTLSTPTEYSFVPDGSGGFSVLNERYNASVNHVSFGTAEFSSTIIRRITSSVSSLISWNADTTSGTSVKLYAKLSDGAYIECENGYAIPCVVSGKDYSNETLYIKVELSTEDVALSPCVSDILIQIVDSDDDHVLVLNFSPGITNSVQNSVNDITVSYDGLGSLHGIGGPVSEFEVSFTPENLNRKHNPHDPEHIEAEVRINSNLIHIYYTDSSETEHIEAHVQPIGLLISVDDI